MYIAAMDISHFKSAWLMVIESLPLSWWIASLMFYHDHWRSGEDSVMKSQPVSVSESQGSCLHFFPPIIAMYPFFTVPTVAEPPICLQDRPKKEKTEKTYGIDSFALHCRVVPYVYDPSELLSYHERSTYRLESSKLVETLRETNMSMENHHFIAV